MPPKRILEVRKVDRAEAEKLGCPGGDVFDGLFGENCNEILAINFDTVLPEEVPVNSKLIEKSAVAMEKVKTLSNKSQLLGDPTVLEGEDLNVLFKPSESRPVSDRRETVEAKMTSIQFPHNLVKQFIQHAWPHSPKEHMAWITGKILQEKVPGTKGKDVKFKDISVANGLFFPKQSSTETCVFEIGDSASVVKFCEESGSMIVGWIHSHPTFEAFFSSIDCHMQHQIQKDVPLAYGLVVDQNRAFRCMRLTPAGMETVANCKESSTDSCLLWGQQRVGFGTADIPDCIEDIGTCFPIILYLGPAMSGTDGRLHRRY